VKCKRVNYREDAPDEKASGRRWDIDGHFSISSGGVLLLEVRERQGVPKTGEERLLGEQESGEEKHTSGGKEDKAKSGKHYGRGSKLKKAKKSYYLKRVPADGKNRIQKRNRASAPREKRKGRASAHSCSSEKTAKKSRLYEGSRGLAR